MSELEPVDVLINRVIESHPGMGAAAQLRYFEAVHQELAPLARALEIENRQLRQELENQRAGRFDLLEAANKKLDKTTALVTQARIALERSPDCPHCSKALSLLTTSPRRQTTAF